MSDKPLLNPEEKSEQRDQIDLIIAEAELEIQETYNRPKISFSDDVKKMLRKSIEEGIEGRPEELVNQHAIAMKIVDQMTTELPPQGPKPSRLEQVFKKHKPDVVYRESIKNFDTKELTQACKDSADATKSMQEQRQTDKEEAAAIKIQSAQRQRQARIAVERQKQQKRDEQARLEEAAEKQSVATALEQQKRLAAQREHKFETREEIEERRLKPAERSQKVVDTATRRKEEAKRSAQATQEHRIQESQRRSEALSERHSAAIAESLLGSDEQPVHTPPSSDDKEQHHQHDNTPHAADPEAIIQGATSGRTAAQAAKAEEEEREQQRNTRLKLAKERKAQREQIAGTLEDTLRENVRAQKYWGGLREFRAERDAATKAIAEKAAYQIVSDPHYTAVSTQDAVDAVTESLNEERKAKAEEFVGEERFQHHPERIEEVLVRRPANNVALTGDKYTEEDVAKAVENQRENERSGQTPIAWDYKLASSISKTALDKAQKRQQRQQSHDQTQGR